MNFKLIALLSASTLVLAYTVFAVAPLPDQDSDGVPDEWDNCLDIANATQTDCDLDGYGNLCDADYDNDTVIGAGDFSILAASFQSNDGDANFNACVDCDDDGVIGAADFSCLAAGFQGSPGPSGLDCADASGATIPCFGI